MSEVKRELEHPEVFHAIKESIGDARDSIRKLAEIFSENVQPLRLEESDTAFTTLSQSIEELACFIEFQQELKLGLSYYERFGLPEDPISRENFGLNLFRNMHSAMESKDWIVLSDLIEYELSPLLMKEDEWLGLLDTKVMEYQS